MEAWFAKLSPEEYATWWFKRNDLFHRLRWELVAAEHPGASEAELKAHWFRATYRHSLLPELLERYARSFLDADGRGDAE